MCIRDRVHTYTYSAITTELRGQELVDFDANSKEEIVVGFSDDGRGVQSSMMMETAMKAAKANNSIIAVSYTHLDVYKRQINNIKLFIHVTNFADSRSLLTHPASTTHAQMSEEERIAGGVKQETIRMSVGLEDVEDLIADLKQAFAKI